MKKDTLLCLMKTLEEIQNVDKFTKKTGAVAAILVRDGIDYKRVASTIPGIHSESTVDTVLDKTSPIYIALKRGNKFIGKVYLFTRPYFVYYKPYFMDKNNSIIIALFVGIPLCGVDCKLSHDSDSSDSKSTHSNSTSECDSSDDRSRKR